MNAPHPGDDRLIAYVLDELEPPERARVESHMDACDQCRKVVLALAGAVEGVRRADEPEAPAHVLVDLLEAQADARARRGSRPWFLRPVATAAAAALLVGIFFGGFLAGRQTGRSPALLASGADTLGVIRAPLPEPPEIPFQTARGPVSD